MNEYDVVVIGGGAAGLSAALVLTRALRQVAVVDAGQPRNAPAAHMQGFLGSDGLPPTELLAAGRNEVAGYGGHLLPGRVDTASRRTLPIRRRADELRHRARRRVRDAEPSRAGHHRVARRRPGPPGRARTVGPRPAPLPVLPRPRGPRTAPGRPRRFARGARPCPPHPSVVPRRRLLRQRAPLTAEQREQLAARAIGVVDAPVARLVVEDDRLTGVELATGQVVPRDRRVRPARASSPTTHCSPTSAARPTTTAGSPSTPRVAPASPASGQPGTRSTHAPRSSPQQARARPPPSPSTTTSSTRTSRSPSRTSGSDSPSEPHPAPTNGVLGRCPAPL